MGFRTKLKALAMHLFHKSTQQENRRREKPWGGGLRKKWSSQLEQICMWKGGFEKAKL